MDRYVICHTDGARKICEDTIDRLKGRSKKAHRTLILL